MTDVHTGQVLSMIARMVCPMVALELGTFSGYGTLCLLEGLHQEGALHTVERNDELFALQDEFWSRHPRHSSIVRHHGMALDVLGKWPAEHPIDLVYVDADKQGVNGQLDALLPLMSKGGWMLFDNTWWNGTLADAVGPKPEGSAHLKCKAGRRQKAKHRRAARRRRADGGQKSISVRAVLRELRPPDRQLPEAKWHCAPRVRSRR